MKFFIGYALFPGEKLGRRYSNYLGWRIWKFGVIEIFFRKLNAKEVLVTQRDEESVFLAADGSAKLSGRNYKFQEPTLRRESIVRRENISGESQGDGEEFQPEESKRWRRNQQGFLGSRRSSERISLIVIISNREVQLHVPRKDHILFDWNFFWCHQVNKCSSRGCTRKANLWLLGCRREQKFVNIVNEFHKIYVIEGNSSEKV